jgi:hypothetical protein
MMFAGRQVPPVHWLPTQTPAQQSLGALQVSPSAAQLGPPAAPAMPPALAPAEAPAPA